MRTRVAAISAVLAIAVATPAPPAAAKPKPLPDRVQVRGFEFDLVLSKRKVKPGRVIVQFVNQGEDPHDLRLQRVNPAGSPDGAEFGFGELGPGSYQNLDARLRKRSSYRLWCSLSDHRSLGMEATLRTRRHRG
jgi:hypothetical protein